MCLKKVLETFWGGLGAMLHSCSFIFGKDLENIRKSCLLNNFQTGFWFWKRNGRKQFKKWPPPLRPGGEKKHLGAVRITGQRNYFFNCSPLKNIKLCHKQKNVEIGSRKKISIF